MQDRTDAGQNGCRTKTDVGQDKSWAFYRCRTSAGRMQDKMNAGQE